MCCWPWKKGRKKKNRNKKSDDKPGKQDAKSTSEVPSEMKTGNEAIAGTRKARNSRSSSPEGRKRGIRSLGNKKWEPSSGAKEKVVVGELHERMKNKELATQEQLMKMSHKERKKRLAAAQKALGFTPNTAIVDRLVKRDRERLEKTQTSQMSRLEVTTTSSKMGDIAFGLPHPKKKTQDDDTQFQKIGAKKESDCKGQQRPSPGVPADGYFQPPVPEQQESDELLSEDEEGVPDETNWMYHTKEMQATQDIIRIADGNVSKYSFGDMSTQSRQGITFDPYAPLSDLENDEEKQQKVFGCIALRYGTFITTTQMAPTDKEKSEAAKRMVPQIPMSNLINAGADISQFAIDYADEGAAESDSDRENWQPGTDEALKATEDSQKKKKPAQERTSRRSSRQANTAKQSKKGASGELRPSKEKLKNSREYRQGSKESKRTSREAKALVKPGSKESRRAASQESGRRSREDKRICKTQE